MSRANVAELAGLDRFTFASRISQLGLTTATFERVDVEDAAPRR